MPRRNRKRHAAPGRNRSRRIVAELRLPNAMRRDPDGGPVVRVRCFTGKTGYVRAEAERRLERIGRRPEQAGRVKPVRVYECPECGLWHLTSVPLEQFLRGRSSGG